MFSAYSSEHSSRSESEAVAPREYAIAVVDDDIRDFVLLKCLIRKSRLPNVSCVHYSSITQLMNSATPRPDVVFLDRYLPDSQLGESRIREIRARHDKCGVILHTALITPSLRSTAAHEGAVAVVEKGTVSERAISALISAAAEFGPQIQTHF